MEDEKELLNFESTNNQLLIPLSMSLRKPPLGLLKTIHALHHKKTYALNLSPHCEHKSQNLAISIPDQKPPDPEASRRKIEVSAIGHISCHTECKSKILSLLGS